MTARYYLYISPVGSSNVDCASTAVISILNVIVNRFCLLQAPKPRCLYAALRYISNKASSCKTIVKLTQVQLLWYVANAAATGSRPREKLTWWTNRSSPPWLGVIKPYPFYVLYHFTTPLLRYCWAITVILRERSDTIQTKHVNGQLCTNSHCVHQRPVEYCGWRFIYTWNRIVSETPPTCRVVANHKKCEQPILI